MRRSLGRHVRNAKRVVLWILNLLAGSVKTTLRLNMVTFVFNDKYCSYCYPQPPLLMVFTPPHPPPPQQKWFLKLVCNVNIVYGNLRSENFRIFMNSASVLTLT